MDTIRQHMNDNVQSNDVQQKYDTIKRVVDDVEGELGSEISKLRQKAAETDPEKRFYGEKAIAKIQELGKYYDQLVEETQKVKDEVLPKYQSLIQQEEQRKQQEEEAAKRKQEEERRQREEALRQELQRQEEEAKRKKEEVRRFLVCFNTI